MLTHPSTVLIYFQFLVPVQQVKCEIVDCYISFISTVSSSTEVRWYREQCSTMPSTAAFSGES